MWPLQLIDVVDGEQMTILQRLLRYLPQLIAHYLSSIIFPQTMLHQTLKLSANAQELGGDNLFQVRLGFSGTPSDLLPLELGRCQYAAGDDAKMLRVLTSTEHVTYMPLSLEWSVDSLLDTIANASPPYNALIDTGALVTGLTNLQVAARLLTAGLPRSTPWCTWTSTIERWRCSATAARSSSSPSAASPSRSGSPSTTRCTRRGWTSRSCSTRTPCSHWARIWCSATLRRAPSASARLGTARS